MNIKTKFSIGQTVKIIDTPEDLEYYKGIIAVVKGILITEDVIKYHLKVTDGLYISRTWNEEHLIAVKGE